VSPRAAAPFSRAFGELRGKLGTFAVLGNHDYFAGARAVESAVRDAGAQLVLSGHTHGGQIALSPQWSLARVLGPYTMGLYALGDSRLYVHRGMGTVGPVPVRLGSPPEIALLTLRRV
jgi:predicted MPP superfamily phosphohydrolase